MEHKKITKHNLNEGFDLIIRASEKGNMKAINYLALSYKNGMRVEKNVEKVDFIIIFINFF
jgi:hypothetical protein